MTDLPLDKNSANGYNKCSGSVVEEKWMYNP